MMTCKDPRCGAKIQFGVNDHTGRRVPIDISPVDEGNIVWEAGTGLVHVLTDVEKLTDTRPRYLSHFVTCVARQEFRGGRRSRKRGAGA